VLRYMQLPTRGELPLDFAADLPSVTRCCPEFSSIPIEGVFDGEARRVRPIACSDPARIRFTG
jgi:hypothetical protein